MPECNNQHSESVARIANFAIARHFETISDRSIAISSYNPESRDSPSVEEKCPVSVMFGGPIENMSAQVSKTSDATRAPSPEIAVGPPVKATATPIRWVRGILRRYPFKRVFEVTKNVVMKSDGTEIIDVSLVLLSAIADFGQKKKVVIQACHSISFVTKRNYGRQECRVVRNGAFEYSSGRQAGRNGGKNDILVRCAICRNHECRIYFFYDPNGTAPTFFDYSGNSGQRLG